MKNLFDLTGKRALITGSAQGIGNLLASGSAAHGAEIVINDITQQRAQAAADKLVQSMLTALLAMDLMSAGQQPSRKLKRTLGPLIF